MNLQDAWQRLSEAEDEPDPERRIELLHPLLSWARSTPGLPSMWQIEPMRLLANVHQDKGELQDAYGLRVEAARLAADPGGDCPALLRLRVEGDLGRSYVEVRDWKRAEEQFRKALALAEECREERDAIVQKLNLYLVYDNTGRGGECRKLEEEVLRWAEEHNDRYVLALQHFNTAVRLYREVRLNECHRHVEEALAHAIWVGNAPLQAAARRLQGEALHLGFLLTGRQRYSNESERHLLRSREEAAALGNSVLEAHAALGLADFYESRHRISAAFRAYESALSALEKVRDQLGFEEFQLSFFRSLEPIYGRTVEFLLRQKRTEDAFRTAELLRSRLLLEALGPQRSDPAAWAPEQRLHLERVLDDFGSAALDRRIADASAARRELLHLQEEQALSQARWHTRSSPPVASFEAAQESLGDRDALLAYFVTDDSLAIFVATKQNRHFQHLPYPRRRLASDVDQIRREIEVIQSRFRSPGFREAWHNRDVRRAGVESILHSEERLQARLERLYALLIAPVCAAVAGRPHWVIVPHGPLHRLPWAALRSGGQYLVERHTLSLLPSASIGAVLQERSPSKGEAVFFADPDPDHPGLALQGAAEEAQAGCDALRAGPPPFLGAAATKEELLARVATAGLVHFACHHLFDDEVPQLSFLKMAGNRGSHQLFAFEVSELRLATRLVTLAACGSGQSQTAVGDEQMGMVRSFLSAGARSVISALWPIADESTARLFSLFYRIAQHAGLAEALAQGQRELLRDPRYNLPCFWAPFVLSGEWKEPLHLQRSLRQTEE
jgi:tetratricopeptide (TPR) repeat protein